MSQEEFRDSARDAADRFSRLEMDQKRWRNSPAARLSFGPRPAGRIRQLKAQLEQIEARSNCRRIVSITCRFRPRLCAMRRAPGQCRTYRQARRGQFHPRRGGEADRHGPRERARDQSNGLHEHSSTNRRFSVSTITWVRRPSRTCSCCASPIRFSSACGAPATSTTCR